MKSIQAAAYPIHFAGLAYAELNSLVHKNRYSALFILTDTNTNEHCLPEFISNLETDLRIEIIEIESGEAVKTIDTCVEIWKVLTELGADRKSLLLNLGGGVITDLGGFVASTYKRGIDFIHVPTTLLAMVDAAVGGKNGVDLGTLKNQVGVICAPQMLVIETKFLQSLDQKQLRSGLAEMLKHGLIYDAAYWKEVSDFKSISFADFDQLIHKSIEIKNEIVSQDPREKGLRKSLNFGHTLGHAIESYFLESSHKPTLLHGEAIAAGMILESFIAMRKGLLNREEYAEIKNVIDALFDPIGFDETDLEPILELLRHDKKNEYGKILFALIDRIGRASIDELVDPPLLLEAFEAYKT